jgi:high-affinity Fe2+/Pb2+ permease
MSNVSSRKVLLSSLLLPGSGHVWLGNAQRGLVFLFFMVMFGWLSNKLMPDTASFIGRNIGAVFVYGISVIDAYRSARLRDIQK